MITIVALGVGVGGISVGAAVGGTGVAVGGTAVAVGGSEVGVAARAGASSPQADMLVIARIVIRKNNP